jgi:periplasmic protein TonB
VPVVVPNNTPIEDSVPTVEEREQNVIGKENYKTDEPGSETNVSDKNIKSAPLAPPIETPEIFELGTVQEPASFPGGNKALLRFMENNIRDPRNGEEDLAQSVKVQVKFVVGKDGQPTDFVVIGSGGEKFDNEVLRVLKGMPKWKPAWHHNQRVAMFFIMPVSFAVKENE